MDAREEWMHAQVRFDCDGYRDLTGVVTALDRWDDQVIVLLQADHPHPHLCGQEMRVPVGTLTRTDRRSHDGFRVGDFVQITGSMRRARWCGRIIAIVDHQVDIEFPIAALTGGWHTETGDYTLGKGQFSIAQEADRQRIQASFPDWWAKYYS